jgi:ubiquitin-like-conjugating enzyme ATG10
MAHHSEYRQWPFLTPQEFDVACSYFDRRYIQAKLGPVRKIFKISHHRSLTTAASYVEILRLLQLPKDPTGLIRLLEKLGAESVVSEVMDIDTPMAEEQDDEALNPNQNAAIAEETPPMYSLYCQQSYVTYEIHLHPTYQVPTLWFTLHDLPNGESPLDVDSLYRYLVPEQHKSHLRARGVMGGISAAHHPVTDVPAFFIHPCQTKEAMEVLDCPIEDYLMAWIGLVGGCVGLWIPFEMGFVSNL